MTLRGSKSGKPPRQLTPAQQIAHRRTFRIFNLRGLWVNCMMLTGWRQKVARMVIDLELRRLGAEPEGVRDTARRAYWDQQYGKDRLQREMDEEIPF